MAGLDLSAGQGTLRAAGRVLEWAGWPGGEGPVLVLLHEGLGSVGLWRGFPARLAQAIGLSVFAYSREGYGQSDPADLPLPLDYMTRHATGVLPQVLDTLGARQVVLVGHSDGATIALEHAARTADPRVRGLVLMAPHVFAERVGLAQITRAGEAFRTGDLAARMARWHRDPEATFRGWHQAWLNPDFLRWDIRDVLEYLRIPALVIQGRQDEYGTEAQVHTIAERSPAPVEVAMLDDCRHSPQFDQPEAVLSAIRGFVTRLRAHEAARPLTA